MARMRILFEFQQHSLINADKNSISFFGGPYKAYGLAQFDFLFLSSQKRNLYLINRQGEDTNSYSF